MTLDWGTAQLLDRLSEVDEKLRHPHTVDDLRALAHWLATDNGPGPAMESVEDVHLPVESTRPGEPTARLRVMTSRPTTSAVVLFLPGPAWGWVAGTLDTTDTVCRKLAERTGCTFVVLEHRKAPEHPYPAAADDAWAALLWAEEYRRSLPSPTPPLVVVGEGSGASLAAMLARRSCELAGPELGLLVLISPCLDTRIGRRSYSRYGDEGLLSTDLMDELWKNYLPEATDQVRPDAVPLMARAFDGHPPTLLLAPTNDPVDDEGYEYLARLASAGVSTERRAFDGQMHGFFGILALPVGERAFQAVIVRIRAYVAAAATSVAA